MVFYVSGFGCMWLFGYCVLYVCLFVILIGVFWVFYGCLCFMLVLFVWVALVLLFVLCNGLAFCDCVDWFGFWWWCWLGWLRGLSVCLCLFWVSDCLWCLIVALTVLYCVVWCCCSRLLVLFLFGWFGDDWWVIWVVW